MAEFVGPINLTLTLTALDTKEQQKRNTSKHVEGIDTVTNLGNLPKKRFPNDRKKGTSLHIRNSVSRGKIFEKVKATKKMRAEIEVEKSSE